MVVPASAGVDVDIQCSTVGYIIRGLTGDPENKVDCELSIKVGKI